MKARIPNLAAIIGDNLVPIAGVLFLQWKAANLVLTYFAGFLLDIGACAVLLWMLSRDRPDLNPEGTAAGKVKAVLGMLVGLAALVGVFAFAFGFPVFAVVHGDPSLSIKGLLTDPAFAAALAVYLAMAASGFVPVYRAIAGELARDPAFKPELPIRRRFAFVTSRWVVVLAASFFLPIPVMLVIAYCAASIWFEIKSPVLGQAGGARG